MHQVQHTAVRTILHQMAALPYSTQPKLTSHNTMLQASETAPTYSCPSTPAAKRAVHLAGPALAQRSEHRPGELCLARRHINKVRAQRGRAVRIRALYAEVHSPARRFQLSIPGLNLSAVVCMSPGRLAVYTRRESAAPHSLFRRRSCFDTRADALSTTSVVLFH